MTTPRETAEDAYVRAHMMARDLIEKLSGLIDDLPAPRDDGPPIHWGHVGDLNHVNAILLDAVAFLDKH